MSLQTWLVVAWAIVAGACIAVQGPINAMLAARLGHALPAATISFAVGGVALLVATAIFARGAMDLAVIPTLAPYLVIAGGLLGAMYVASSVVLTPRLGIAAVIALGIAGQMISSLLLDHYGALGLITRELTIGRVSGAVLVLAGALMVRFL